MVEMVFVQFIFFYFFKWNFYFFIRYNIFNSVCVDVFIIILYYNCLMVEGSGIRKICFVYVYLFNVFCYVKFLISGDI